MNQLITSNQPLTMSSREIAELTGKEKKTVHRDIKSMAEQLGYGTDVYHDSKFGITLHHDNRGYCDMILLDRKHTDCLLTGYSAKARMKVIERWHELEQQSNPKVPTNFAEALQLAADQAKQLELAAPKVAFVDNLVDRTALMNASQVAQKHKKSAIWLNKILTELKVYNKAIKRGKVFQQWFIDKGYGEMKQSEEGYSQAMFTNAGEIWINEQLHSEGIV